MSNVDLGGFSDKTLKLWDTTSGKLIRLLKGHSGLVYAVAFAPDGRIAASSGTDDAVPLCAVIKGQAIATLKNPDDFIDNYVDCLAFSPDGRSLLSGSRDKTLRLWDVASRKLIRTFMGHTDGVTFVAFTPDGLQPLSRSYDDASKVWDVASGQVRRSFGGKSGGVIAAGARRTAAQNLLSGDMRFIWSCSFRGRPVRSFQRKSGYMAMGL